jgi:hypothetical protein
LCKRKLENLTLGEVELHKLLLRRNSKANSEKSPIYEEQAG